MKHLHNLYLIIGESGTGKDSVVNQLCGTYGLDKVQSYTTRPKRQDDENKSTHIFINKDDIERIENIVAMTEFDGNFYCGTQEQVDDADFYIIDKQGILYFKEHYQGDRDYKIIYITAPCFVRENRMIRRGDSPENVAGRIAHDEIAFRGISELADITINNIVLTESANDVWAYIQQEEQHYG